MSEAAHALRELCGGAVLIKGGHLAGDQVIDLLYCGGVYHEFSDPRVDTKHTHGTGCALAAAIAAHLACGTELPEAVARARAFVRRGLELAVALGRGCNPINHLAANR
jgi:hydroxymethylpyrimidine/phosphomethylpyrimidine kinase